MVTKVILYLTILYLIQNWVGLGLVPVCPLCKPQHCQSALRLNEESYTPTLEHIAKYKWLKCRVQLLMQLTVLKNLNTFFKLKYLFKGEGKLIVYVQIDLHFISLSEFHNVFVFHQVLHFQSREQRSSIANPVVLQRLPAEVSTHGMKWVKKHDQGLLQNLPLVSQNCKAGGQQK